MQMVDLVHQIAEKYLMDGSRAVDATMGNGKDTEALCRLVGSHGLVYAFDIQEEALRLTRLRLEKAGLSRRAKLFLCSHAKAADMLAEPVDLFVFNLGYMPGGDKRIITRGESTVQAVNGLLCRLKIGGLGLILSYYGHEGGPEEKRILEAFLKELPGKEYDVTRTAMVNRSHFPPILYAIKKLS